MDPAISQALATLIGALATAVLMYASYNWGPGRGGRRKKSDDTPEEDDA